MRSFAVIQKKANSFFDRLIRSGLETTITYKKFRSSTYDDATGMQVTTYDEYEVKAIRIDTSLEAQKGSSLTSGAFGTGEVQYLIKAEDSPRTNVYDPEVLKDFISDEGLEKQVKTAILLVKTFVRFAV